LERTVPFFAVAGTIVGVLNWQDFLARRSRFANDLRNARWALLGRIATVIIVGGLVFLAWPGWLNREGRGRIDRRVSWAIHVDPSLQGAAEKLEQLRAQGVLGENGFNYTADIANYCAWFCPSARSFIDYRFSLFPESLGTHQELREALAARADGGTYQGTSWPDIFRQRNISHVIVGGGEPDWIALTQPLWQQPHTWVLLYADGRTSIFGWRAKDEGDAKRLERNRVDFDALAFGPDIPAERQAPEKAPPVPSAWPWWRHYTEAVPPRPLAADMSRTCRAYFFTMAQAEAHRLRAMLHDLRKMAAWAMPVLASGAGGGLPSTLYSLPWTLRLPPNNILYRFEDDRLYGVIRPVEIGPAGALTLASREARRGIAANPNDVVGYAALADAYRASQELERAWLGGTRGGWMYQLRLVQIATALHNALLLEPDDPGLHQALAETYQRMDVATFVLRSPQAPVRETYLDLEIDHRRQAHRHARSRGPASFAQQSAEDFQRQLDELERQINEQEKSYELQRRLDQFEVAAANKPPLERALHAIQLGLVKKALDDLAAVPQLSKPEADLYAHLLLVTGRAATLVEAEHRFQDPWDAILLAAATGDYRKADVSLEEWGRELEETGMREILRQSRQLNFPPAGSALAQNIRVLLNVARLSFETRADLLVVRGVLALEWGETKTAAACLRRALEITAAPTSVARVLSLLASRSVLDAIVIPVSAAHLPGVPAVMFASRPLAAGYLHHLERTAARLANLNP
jgi:hypothetical protein